MSSGREVTAFWGPQDSILVLTELEMPISPAADNKLPFLLIRAAPRVSGMSPVPLPVPGGLREQPKPAARRPQNTRTRGMLIRREMLIRRGVHSQGTLQAGTGAAPAGNAEGCWAPGRLRNCSAGFGNIFPITEPRSACPGLGLPRSSLLITGPIFC